MTSSCRVYGWVIICFLCLFQVRSIACFRNELITCVCCESRCVPRNYLNSAWWCAVGGKLLLTSRRRRFYLLVTPFLHGSLVSLADGRIVLFLGEINYLDRSNPSAPSRVITGHNKSICAMTVKPKTAIFTGDCCVN